MAVVASLVEDSLAVEASLGHEEAVVQEPEVCVHVFEVLEAAA